jgi:uncharacterized protein (DUF2062 family)
MIFYPKGGWRRAASYVAHRLRRLPDTPERIAIGVGAGIAISFTPLFGFHFVGAVLIAWIFRGNFFAAILATFFGNPLTFPIIVAVSLEFGNLLLGKGAGMHFPQVMSAFGGASAELTANIGAIFGQSTAHWAQIGVFFRLVFLPYLLGGVIVGSVAGVVGYMVSLPLIQAYQKRRRKKLRERFLKARQTRGQRVPAETDNRRKAP